jgi:short-subunit dehydrogenase
MRRDFRHRYGPWAVVAGASEGIGAAYARRVAAAGINVVIMARRAGPLRGLADDLRDATRVEVRPLAVDLSSRSLLDVLAPAVSDIEVGLLVYNAGATERAAVFVRQPLDDALALIDRNCRAVAQLAHHFGAAMAERGRGGIVLMSSLSAAAGSGYTAVYSATKAFDVVLAEGLWIELGQSSVDVLAVPAGLTDTPAMRRSGIIDANSGFPAMDADDVAREALDALGIVGPILVPGEANKQAAGQLWPVERAPLIQAMTAGASALYGLPTLPLPNVH